MTICIDKKIRNLIKKKKTIKIQCFVFQVPPSIIDKETSTDMVVREANNATLICKAAGYPEPYVMWRREDGDDINYNGDTGTII